MINLSYDVIVVGAGHAGCDAALASARLGSSTLLITMDLTKCAQMSCNPAIGGIAKGQIVREIDALGGGIGLITDRSTIQFRMLNRSKGPAMWSPRAQCDRMLFSASWRYLLENTKNLDLWQDEVCALDFDSAGKLCGVKTRLGANFKSRAVVITAGTFLNGLIHIGLTHASAGRIGEPAAIGLTQQLCEHGLISSRMKTGTPPRIDARSLDLPSLTPQPGDELPQRFSYLPVPSAIQSLGFQRSCYLVYTNTKVHDILRTGFDCSPLFTGLIHGKGPRYCPSIEDKLRTFADKDQHPLFLEPEGWNTQEYYLQGFSSSLPIDVQFEALRAIEGLEKVRIYRPAYAIEYDYFPPTQLTHSLEVKAIPNLFFAGQVNGTTGYEEAAAQGFMAGVNAHLKINELNPFVLGRDEAYIGVLIDDLVTKGVDEPYRMFTSRAEYRILLRQDNADERLTSLGFALGTVSKERLKVFHVKHKVRNEVVSYLQNESLTPDKVNPLLQKLGTSEITQKRKFEDILGRPQVTWTDIVSLVSRETLEQWEQTLKPIEEQFQNGGEEILINPQAVERVWDRAVGTKEEAGLDTIAQSETKQIGGRSNEMQDGMLDDSEGALGRAKRESTETVSEEATCALEESARCDSDDFATSAAAEANPATYFDWRLPAANPNIEPKSVSLAQEVFESAEIMIKYKGYIMRERLMANKLQRLENVQIPANFKFAQLLSLSTESRQKLERIQPRTIGQASRIPGVSPADIAVLLLYLGR